MQAKFSELKTYIKVAKAQLENSKRRIKSKNISNEKEINFFEHLTLKEQAFLLGVKQYAEEHTKFSTDELVEIMGAHAIKFGNLIDLVMFEPNLVEILRVYGDVYVCEQLIRDRVAKEKLSRFKKGE